MRAARRFLKRAVVWSLTVATAAAAAIFAVNNRAPVEIDLMPFDVVIAVPAFVILLAGLAGGVGLAVLSAGISLMRLRLRLARARRDAADYARQIEHLRRRGAEMEARLQAVERRPDGRPSSLPVAVRSDAA